MSSEQELEKKMITLMSSDGETFQVDEAVAMQSETLKHLIEDACADSAIPLSNVKTGVLSKVIEYCKMHVDSGKMHVDSDNDEKDIQAWDKKFIEVDQAMLFDLIWAANYLDIKSLLDLTCQTVANMMKGKTPEAIRATFHIQNDYTPEEEAEIRRENQWAFDC